MATLRLILIFIVSSICFAQVDTLELLKYYPQEIGHTWTYPVSTTFSDIQTDSVKKYLTNQSEDLQVSVTKNMLLDSLTVYKMKEES